jgi:mono/diheme cytochrome c family protein
VFGARSVSGFVLCGLVSFAPAAMAAEPLARGEYLVSHVAMCVQCHTPRDAKGELDRTRLFRGAPIPLRSPFPNRSWALAAPAIAGLPGWSSEDAGVLLTTGRRPMGYTPKPPMPPFRLSREDADAVIAFLRSVP